MEHDAEKIRICEHFWNDARARVNDYEERFARLPASEFFLRAFLLDDLAGAEDERDRWGATLWFYQNRRNGGSTDES